MSPESFDALRGLVSVTRLFTEDQRAFVLDAIARHQDGAADPIPEMPRIVTVGKIDRSRVETVWMYLLDGHGGEGYCMAPLPGRGMSVPLIGRCEESIGNMRPLAQWMANQSGSAVRLVKFHTREDLELIEPVRK